MRQGWLNNISTRGAFANKKLNFSLHLDLVACDHYVRCGTAAGRKPAWKAVENNRFDGLAGYDLIQLAVETTAWVLDFCRV